MNRLIKNKTKVLIVAIVLMLSIFLSFFSYNYINYKLLDNNKNNFYKVSSSMGCHISQLLSFSSSLVKQIAKQDKVTKLLMDNPDNTENILQDYLETYNLNNNYSSIYIMNRQGKVISATNSDFIGHDYGFRNYFKRSMSNRLGTEAVLGATTQHLGYYFSYPVRSTLGEILGVVVVKLKPEVMNEDIKLSSNKFKHVMLTDNSGIVIFSDRAENVYKSLGELTEEERQEIIKEKRFSGINIESLGYSFAQKVIRNKEELRSVYYKDAEDKSEKIISIAKVCKYPFYVVIEDLPGKYINTAYHLSLVLGIFSLASALLSLILILIFLGRLLKPLHSLAEATEELTEGNYSVKVDNKGFNSYTTSLLNSFNSMTKTIYRINKEAKEELRVKEDDLENKKKELKEQQKAILNILDDVEHQKNKAEQEKHKANTILYNIGDAVFAVDENKKLIFINKAIKKLGKCLQEEKSLKSNRDCQQNNVLNLIYTEVFKFFKDEDKKKLDNFIDKAIKNNKIVSNSKNGILVIKDKKELAVLATAAPWTNKKGEVKGCIVVFHDVNEERRIDRIKTEFVSLASHQLRTPLATVNWYIEMLLSKDIGKMNKQQKEYLQEVFHSNKKMISLVNALLNVSRIELGRVAVDPINLDVVAVCNDVLRDFKEIIKEKKMKVIVEHKEKIIKLKADKNLLRIILQNLISNAIKYSPDKRKINIKITNIKNEVVIEVKDQGIGIPVDQQKKLFNKLFRASNAAKSDTAGTGLGLYLIKTILDVTGGRISFESIEGEGSTFKVAFPKKGMISRKGEKKLV